VEYLREYCGSNINKRCVWRRDGLMYAAMYGHLKIVKYLHQEGCSIHKIDVYGESAFMYACRNSHMKVIKYLHENGSTAEEQINLGKDLITISLRKTFVPEIILFLLEHGFRLQNSFPVRYHYEALQIQVWNKIEKMQLVQNAIKGSLPDIELLIIDVLCDFTNGLKNVKIAATFLVDAIGIVSYESDFDDTFYDIYE
jgi:hypothetical protein